jgi:hypothetical protein
VIPNGAIATNPPRRGAMAGAGGAAYVSADNLIIVAADARRGLRVVVRRSAKRYDRAKVDIRHPVAIVAGFARRIPGGAERPHFAEKRLVAIALHMVARVVAKIMVVARGGEIDAAGHTADWKRGRAATVGRWNMIWIRHANRTHRGRNVFASALSNHDGEQAARGQSQHTPTRSQRAETPGEIFES